MTRSEDNLQARTAMTDRPEAMLPGCPPHDYQCMVIDKLKESGDWLLGRPKIDRERSVIVCTKCGGSLNV